MPEVLQDSSAVDLLDVLVIGAGFSGSIIGIRASEMGMRVKVLDSNEHYPDHFRAEKLETDQCDMLNALGLLDLVQPQNTPPITSVHTFKGKKVSVNYHQQQRGMRYSDTVNAFRDRLSELGLLEKGRVLAVDVGADSVLIGTNTDCQFKAKLVVLATGMEPNLRKSIGLEATTEDKLISTTFGFEISPKATEGFNYGAFNFRPQKFISGLYYITFFPIGRDMRANLFTNWAANSDWVARFKADPEVVLRELFPTLEERIGPFKVLDQLQAYTTRYYRLNASESGRVVPIGDAFQSVNPANGVGISKCLTDTTILLEMLPELVANPGRLGEYISDERKQEVDDEALKRWRWAVRSATSRSFSTRMLQLRYLISGKVRKMLSSRGPNRSK